VDGARDDGEWPRQVERAAVAASGRTGLSKRWRRAGREASRACKLRAGMAQATAASGRPERAASC
jgi:hypothetical protein